MCMAMSADGQWIASASKARDAHTAQILLWALSGATSGGATSGSASTGSNDSKMQLADRLPGHESTIVCLEFSPDNR